MASDDEKIERPSRSRGPIRSVLKLLVELNSSRFLRTRIGAAVLLVGMLAVFAAIGYGLPAWLSRYF